MQAVKAAPFAPTELVGDFVAAGRAAGFESETFGESGGCPLIALTKRSPGPHPRIYISTGIHGDEPAGPLALLQLVKLGVFDQRATWFLVPMLNPVGFQRGTRENGEGIDLNRDYRHLQAPEIRAHIRWLEYQPRFSVGFCLHEDWEATGFYLYEINLDNRPSLAEPMIEALRTDYPIDLSELIDGRAAQGGILRPDPTPEARELWAEAMYLRVHHTARGYTLETPSSAPLADRIAMHCHALQTALVRLLTPNT